MLKHNTMKKYLSIILLLFPILTFAQHNWERVNYINSMIISSEVSLDGKLLEAGDTIAAFVNNECRMIAPIIFANNKSYISSVIHGDKAGEIIEFRLWKHKTNMIYVFGTKSTMAINGSLLEHKMNFISIK